MTLALLVLSVVTISVLPRGLSLAVRLAGLHLALVVAAVACLTGAKGDFLRLHRQQKGENNKE
jgi:uncharacterized membrane protein